MKNTENKLITSYDEYIKEMKSPLVESMESNETIDSPFENDVKTEPTEPTQELEVIEPTDFEPSVKESQVILTLEEFLLSK